MSFHCIIQHAPSNVLMSFSTPNPPFRVQVQYCSTECIEDLRITNSVVSTKINSPKCPQSRSHCNLKLLEFVYNPSLRSIEWCIVGLIFKYTTKMRSNWPTRYAFLIDAHRMQIPIDAHYNRVPIDAHLMLIPIDAHFHRVPIDAHCLAF